MKKLETKCVLYTLATLLPRGVKQERQKTLIKVRLGSSIYVTGNAGLVISSAKNIQMYVRMKTTKKLFVAWTGTESLINNSVFISKARLFLQIARKRMRQKTYPRISILAKNEKIRKRLCKLIVRSFFYYSLYCPISNYSSVLVILHFQMAKNL